MAAIRLERTRDYGLIARIMTHPQLYPWIADDFYPAPENFWPMESEAIYYLLALDADDLLGVCMTHPINARLWEVHHAILPEAWGKRALAIARALESWLWENTPARSAIGFTPACNRLACRFAARAGMRQVGRLTGCYQRRSELHDILIFQKSRS